MAVKSRGKKNFGPLKSLFMLVALVVLIFGSVIYGIWKSDASFKPNFALDLEGGTEIVLTPISTNGQQITQNDISQAISIIRQRIDSSGVSEPEISSQGGQNIVVDIPGTPSETTLDLVRRSAKMTFRTVLKQEQSSSSSTSLLTRKYTLSNADIYKNQPASTLAEPEKKKTYSLQANATNPEVTKSDSDYSKLLDSALDDKKIVTKDFQKKFDNFSCDMSGTMNTGQVSDPNAPLITCDTSGYYKYILGPVLIDGQGIDKAQAGLQSGSNGTTTGEWIVNLQLKNKGGITQNGANQFKIVTKKLAKESGDKQQFAIVLDDSVVSAPKVNDEIPNGSAQISGSFTQATANTLANQLNFGSLPIDFRVQSENQISATLGSEQLEKGLMAGIIGLILVIIYSFLQYRALGFVTVGSLTIATFITYGSILFLSWTQGYRLSLAGVTGVIVSIGITADSFIVYFERVKDELRDGRELNYAVDVGWSRAKRTILASDTVNFIAAVVLYFVSVGGVRGFAFTLGLTTIVDLAVVFWFTHPIFKLLAKTNFFRNGHPLSGLDPHKLGARDAIHYSKRVSGDNDSKDLTGSNKETNQAQSIALAIEQDLSKSGAKKDKTKTTNKEISSAKTTNAKPSNIKPTSVQPKNSKAKDGLSIAQRKALQEQQNNKEGK